MQMLFEKMMEYYKGDPKRIQHFVKVHGFAVQIALAEGVDAKTLRILEAAALVHDIGIKAAEEKYNSCVGRLQEQEGPPLAEAMLSICGYEAPVIERVSYLVGHHHSYQNIDGIDYQILVEADFLVNLYEENVTMHGIESVCRKVFKTGAGRTFLRHMFGVDFE